MPEDDRKAKFESLITHHNASAEEREFRLGFVELFESYPIPRDEVLGNLGLFMTRQTLSRVLFMHEMYRRVLDVHGVVMEFGVRWGQNLALFESFRGMYEPFNYSRKIVGFDTFAGFPSVSEKDGGGADIAAGQLNVTEDYESYLGAVLEYHERESPISHLRKFELVKGDATKTLPEYLEAHPETIVSLAYFDMDLYEPTRDCLEAIKPYLTKGSVLGFDELNCADYPGETVALREVFGTGSFKIHRSPLNPHPAYVVFE